MRISTTIFFTMTVLFAAAQKSDSIKFENGYLHFHIYGKGDPVIILSGGPGASHFQMEQVAIETGKTHQAILLEQRGTGRSMPTPYDESTVNIQNARADINLLLNHLRLESAHLLGHSWGAMLAMNYTAFFPEKVRSLILISAGPHKLDPLKFQIYAANKEARLSEDDKRERDLVFEKVQKGIASESEQQAFYKWELLPVIFQRSAVDSLMPLINKGGMNPKTGGLLIQSLFKENADITSRLAAYTRPVNIIVGAQDPGSFMSYEAQLVMRDAKMHWINKCGHFPMFEEPEKFNQILRTVLDDIALEKTSVPPKK